MKKIKITKKGALHVTLHGLMKSNKNQLMTGVLSISDKPYDPNNPEHPYADGQDFSFIRLDPQNLTPEQRDELRKRVPELTGTEIESILRTRFNMGDRRVERLTLDEIAVFLRDYVRGLQPNENPGQSQDLGTVEPEPAETIVLTEEQVKLLNWFMEHHPVIKSVLHFGKFTEKTNLKNADILRQKGLLRKADKGQGRGDIITEKGILYIQDHF